MTNPEFTDNNRLSDKEIDEFLGVGNIEEAEGDWSFPVIEDEEMTPEEAAKWLDDAQDVGGAALGGFGAEEYNADKYPRDLYGDREGRGFAG